MSLRIYIWVKSDPEHLGPRVEAGFYLRPGRSPAAGRLCVGEARETREDIGARDRATEASAPYERRRGRRGERERRG